MSDPARDALPENPPQDLVTSPCVGVCTVDRARNICIGCLRTLPEIGAWRNMTLDQKRATVILCEERAKSLTRLGKDWLPLDETTSF
ncbi:MAG: DUF1289 domain-containing protein [Rhodospirillaceae bacterium]